MSHLNSFSFLWNVIQVTALGLFSLTLSQKMLRRRPILSASILGTAALICIIVTALIPFHFPTQLVQASSPIVATPPLQNSSDVDSSVAINPPRSREAAREDLHLLFAFNPALLLQRITTTSHQPESSALGMNTILQLGLALGCLWSFFQMINQLVVIRRLSRNARFIHDSRFLTIARGLAMEMNSPRGIRFAESESIGSAAVVGWWTPVVIVRSHWQSWTDDELKLVLAHEFAHAKGRDPFWRLISMINRCLHFYNPVVWWLSNRLILTQEFAADQQTISSPEQRTTYLKMLSRLALEEDERLRENSRLPMMPVFSGHLLRRIEMLRAMDCQQNHKGRTQWSWLPIAALVAIGLSTTAMRCLADPEPQQSGSNLNVARPAATTAENPSPQAQQQEILAFGSVILPANEKWFQRSKFSGTSACFTERGGMFLDVAAMRNTKLWPIIAQIWANKHMLLPTDLNPNWDLEALDHIASDSYMIIVPKTKEKKGMMQFGASTFLLTSNRDVDWSQLILQQFPNGTRQFVDGQSHIELMLNLFAPMKMKVVEHSSRELQVQMPQNKLLLKELDSKASSLNGAVHSWASEWGAVSGGILTAALEIPPITELSTDPDQPDQEQVEVLAKSFDFLSFGIDFDQDFRRMQMKFRLRCSKDANLEAAFAAIDWWLKSASQSPADEENVDQHISEMLSEACRNGTVSRIVREPVPAIELEMSCRISDELYNSLCGLIPKSSLPRRNMEQGAASPPTTLLK